MADLTQKFHGLLQHPLEPLFLSKNNGTLFYDLPERFLTSRYRPIGQNLANRFGPNSPSSTQGSNDTGVQPTVVTIRDLKELPDLSFASWVKRRDPFSLFNSEHRKAAGKLMKLFLNQPDADTLVDVAAYARDRLNGPMFQYALSVALLHRPDTKSVPVPSMLHLFPDQFIDPATNPRMMEEGSIVLDENRMAINIPTNFTANDDEPEQRMAFFREDIGVNLHHWHWHLTYPGSGPPEVVRKDRRGELFYYMHQQLLARYQVDRFAQGLGRIEPLANLREPLREAYYPKLLRSANNRPFCARYPGMTVSDVVRTSDRTDVRIADIEASIARVLEAIDAGSAVNTDGTRVPLDNARGIDILGNIIERSALSINRSLYGDLHNSGHTLLAYVHDPRGTYLESFGVMGGVATAMRDPVFYRWHKHVDNLFLRHKSRLAPYTSAELSNSSVTLDALETQLDRTDGATNSLVTFLERSQADLGAGLDFGPAGTAFVSFTHLQFAPFVYRLRINTSARGRRDTIRIFLLPRQDEQRRPLSFDDRRTLAIELDSFRVNLSPGVNTIVRRSGSSSITIPYERTFGNVVQANAGNVQSRFCGCGWPAHMLLPKGNANGVEYDLFAMVSRFEDDNASVEYDENVGCDDSYSFCGLRDRVYPSRRAMGFPFDRRAANSVRSVGDFVAPYRNMRLATVTLRFMNSVIDRHHHPAPVKMSNNRNLLALLQRPLEPTFYPKDNGKTVVDLPENFLTERYRPIGASLQSRFGNDADTRIPVRNVTPPSISFAEVVPRRGGFSLFNPKHRQIAGDLINLFMTQPDVDTLMSAAAYSRDRLNPILFQYALSVAIQHRPDTKDLNIPSFLELFPDSFVDPTVFPKLREEGSIVQAENRMTIDIPLNYTASDREDEQRLAYFREDIGVNLHHWHWHLVYPGEGPSNVVNKDRRGELFYYMHQQLIARYNVERFCNRLARVRPLTNLREPVPEGYFPKIIRSLNNRAFPPRPQNTVLRDINRVDDSVVFTVSDLERSEARIAESIDGGYVVAPGGNRIPLDERTGIDVLGNIMEPSALSVNSQFYGNYHGNLHNILAYSHDPDNRFLEGYGVIGEFQTAMRDPTFYRLHSQVDNMFHRYKRTLQPYNVNQLNYDGVQIQSLGVQLNRANAPANVLLTYWQRSQVDLATGLDFGPEGNVFASFTHLQHAPFTFRLTVNNNTGATRRGTCRIFIGPKVDERNTALTMDEQRLLMVELDKFTVNLNAGTNNIVRRSEQSSVTIPYERTFRQVALSNINEPSTEMFRFCNCGWPHHLLIPKGSPEGMQFDLFAMISNYADDTVNQEFDENVNCNDSHSFCGLRDQLYPDRRAMGYPFDRRMPTTVRSLPDFTRGNTNMATAQVQVRFTNTVIART
ncbi:phenoloxidase 8-like [Anopheles marshallii]|uniref:phenoloxidase 8-like n=1 Tax=Anopheles marshallii TaxID=1521116 RepID=UPI00237B7716|nr:phenoloxidase 8-like [Anopheles marshallii]